MSIRNSLQRAFIDKTSHKKGYHDKGTKLKGSRLSGVGTGNSKVFITSKVVKAPTAAVHLVIDSSISMGGSRLRNANKMAYALSYALDGIKGVTSQTAYYPGTNDECLTIVKPFSAKTQDQAFYRDVTGTTPTGEAVMGASLQLVDRKEQKKFIIVVTDGVPDCVQSLSTALEHAQSLGITVLAFGLETKCYGFSDEQSIECQDVDSLQSAINQALQRQLFN
jgi:Mg-chelatase subunit ChlD